MLKRVLFEKRSFHNSTEAFRIKKNLCPFLGMKNRFVSKVLVIITAWNEWPCSVLWNWKHGNVHYCCLFICITRSWRFAHIIYNVRQQKITNMIYLIKCRHLLCAYCIALSTAERNNKTTPHPVPGNISPFLKSMSIYKMNLKGLLSLKLTWANTAHCRYWKSGKAALATLVGQGEWVNRGNENISKSKVVKAFLWSEDTGT